MNVVNREQNLEGRGFSFSHTNEKRIARTCDITLDCNELKPGNGPIIINFKALPLTELPTPPQILQQ